MGDYFMGEVRTFPYPQGVPTGWLECAGQLLPLNTNQALFSLLGTQYGGDGRTNFALPDLRGRVPAGFGQIPDQNRVAPPGSLPIGTKGGTESVALTLSQMPSHTHSFNVDPNNAVPLFVLPNAIPSTVLKPSTAAATVPPAPNLYAAPSAPPQQLNPAVIKTAGAGAAHENRQPFVALRYCIATSGIYPQRV